MMMFKSLNGLVPVYLHELFSERDTDYDLRDSFRKLIINLPKPRTNCLKRSFSYSGALLWNYLPESIRAIRSIGKFKGALWSKIRKNPNFFSEMFFWLLE